MSFDDIPEASNDFSGSMSASILPDPEPEDALAIFMRTFNAKLDERRQAEQDSENNARNAASDDLNNFNQQRDVRLSAKKDKNRSEEQVLLESVESDAEAVNIWERVTKLIDLSSEAENKKADASRMKKLFIQLKNEPLDVTRKAATN